MFFAVSSFPADIKANRQKASGNSRADALGGSDDDGCLFGCNHVVIWLVIHSR